MLRKAIINTGVIGLLTAGVHAWFITNEDRLDFTFLLAYVLLFVLTTGIYVLLNWVKRSSPDRVGLAFIAGSPIKMLIALGFLIPFILNDGDNARLYAMHFFIPYFVFFGVELYWVMKILRK